MSITHNQRTHRSCRLLSSSRVLRLAKLRDERACRTSVQNLRPLYVIPTADGDVAERTSGMFTGADRLALAVAIVAIVAIIIIMIDAKHPNQAGDWAHGDMGTWGHGDMGTWGHGEEDRRVIIR